jgi:hypothetical protein
MAILTYQKVKCDQCQKEEIITSDKPYPMIHVESLDVEVQNTREQKLQSIEDAIEEAKNDEKKADLIPKLKDKHILYQNMDENKIVQDVVCAGKEGLDFCSAMCFKDYLIDNLPGIKKY